MNHRFRLYIFCIPAALLTACAEGWTEQYRNQYLQSCLEGAHPWARDRRQVAAYCNCALEKTMARYPTIHEAVLNEDSTAMQQDIDACRREALKK
jgi:hypothetical protein